MANQALFENRRFSRTPATDTFNEAKAPAYSFSSEHALAQYAVTGCLNGTFYSDAKSQLDTVKELAEQVSPEFLAKTALYARQQGHMKDMPALLLSILSTKSPKLLKRVFPEVVDNGKMVRNFVQIMRSGQIGRRSLGTAPKKLVRDWIESQSNDRLFRESVGTKPSLSDVIKMVRPRPHNDRQSAFFKYLIGKPTSYHKLPRLVQQYESFKEGRGREVPNVPFQKLDSLELTSEHWKQIAHNAPWHMTRMNLNTFERHGVFEDASLTHKIAARLRDPEQIRKSRVFPYQLMAAFKNADASVPTKVRNALQDAMEIAIENVPQIDAKIVVCPDVSGSMGQSVTGYRRGSSSKVSCHDVSALTAAAFLRRNEDTTVLPFEGSVRNVNLNSRDSVMTNSSALSSIGGGATCCSAPLRQLNERREDADLVVFISDNESWVDANGGSSYSRWRNDGTTMMEEWNQFKQRNPHAKLVCIDIVPNRTTQAQEQADILNIGGFSDNVFSVIQSFALSRRGSAHFTDIIEEVPL